MRAVHDLGPEIRRAISGNLGEEEFPDKEVEEPMHRVCITCVACVNPERGQGVRTPHPLKNHKNVGFSSNTGLDPLKNQSYQVRIQC